MLYEDVSYLLAKSHGEELRRSCENFRCISNKKKRPSLISLLQVLLAKVQGEKNSEVEDGL